MKRGYSHFKIENLFLMDLKGRVRQVLLSITSGFPIRSFLPTSYAQAAKKDLPCNPV
jgi:hypothetical protein